MPNLLHVLAALALAGCLWILSREARGVSRSRSFLVLPAPLALGAALLMMGLSEPGQRHADVLRLALATGAGIGLLPLLNAQLTASLGWRGAFLTLAALPLLLVPLVLWRAVERPATEAGDTSNAPVGATAQAASADPGGTIAFRRALRDAIEGSKNLPAAHGIFNMSPNDHQGFDQRARVMAVIENNGWKLLK